LRRSLPFSQDDFGHASAQCPMMIDFGKTQVLKRHVAQAADSVVGRNLTLADILE
jgi:hypothetical protein